MEDETMTETAEIPKVQAKHPLWDRMKGIYPDKEMTEDSHVMDAAHERLEEDETYRTENEKANESIISAIENEPVLASVMQDIMAGATFIQALARHIDPADLELEKGDPDYEKWDVNKQERLAKKAENESFLQELQSNIAASQEEIKAFADDNGMDENSTMSFIDNVNQVLTDAYKGKITKDFLARMYTAENHEKEVAKAAENGVIEGRNQQIETIKETGMKNKAGDGLPSLAVTSIKVNAPEKPKQKTAAGNFISGTGL